MPFRPDYLLLLSGANEAAAGGASLGSHTLPNDLASLLASNPKAMAIRQSMVKMSHPMAWKPSERNFQRRTQTIVMTLKPATPRIAQRDGPKRARIFPPQTSRMMKVHPRINTYNNASRGVFGGGESMGGIRRKFPACPPSWRTVPAACWRLQRDPPPG